MSYTLLVVDGDGDSDSGDAAYRGRWWFNREPLQIIVRERWAGVEGTLHFVLMLNCWLHWILEVGVSECRLLVPGEL